MNTAIDTAATLPHSLYLMRVLQLHNRYRVEGGEERAVADITALLRKKGHQVSTLERSSEPAGRGRAAAGLLRGGLDPAEVERAVRESGAEVVHAHNIQPLLGWRALAAAQRAGARTVLHLHNFRLFCADAVAYRDGAPCFRCRGTDTRPGIRLRCRGSLPEAALYATGLSRSLPRIFDHVDRFVAVSSATERRLHDLGLPRDASVSLPNFLPDEAFAERSAAARGGYALVAGRLVPEKGFDTAIVAAALAGVPLIVAGEGPDEGRLRALATRHLGGAGPQVTFTGRLAAGDLSALRRGAAVVLAPSRWEEPCPYVVLEAMAAGVPVLAGDRGGLPELVEAENVLAAQDIEAWHRELRRLWADPQLRQQRGDRALRRARERHAAGPYLERLLEIYLTP